MNHSHSNRDERSIPYAFEIPERLKPYLEDWLNWGLEKLFHFDDEKVRSIQFLITQSGRHLPLPKKRQHLTAIEYKSMVKENQQTD